MQEVSLSKSEEFALCFASPLYNPWTTPKHNNVHVIKQKRKHISRHVYLRTMMDDEISPHLSESSGVWSCGVACGWWKRR